MTLAPPRPVRTVEAMAYVTNPANSLNQDPAWLAFLRAAGFEDASDTSDALLQESLMRQRLPGTLEDIHRRYDRGGEQLSTHYERRGIAGSGLEARDRARLDADRGRAVGAATTSVEDSVSRIYSDLQRRVAGRARQGAERALDRVYQSGAI